MDKKQEQSQKQNNRDLRKNKKRTKIIFWVVGIIILITLFFMGYAAKSVSNFFTVINESEEVEFMEESTTILNERLSNKEPFSILVLGVDEREHYETRGLADTIIVVTVNPQHGTIYLMSIPRDTLITLPGTDIEDKINATYAYGGVPYVTEAVEDLVQIPIHAYALLSFEGLKDLVDAVGGVVVDSELAFSIKDDNTGEMQYIDEGRQLLNGAEALGYARMRKEDPQGDWGRQNRQRELVVTLIKRLVSLDSITNYKTILDSISDDLSTNIDFIKATQVIKDYSSAVNTTHTLSIDGQEASRYLPHYGLEVFVYELYEDSLTNTTRRFQNHLGERDFVNTSNNNYDALVEGFPFYSEHAIEELNLEDLVDEEILLERLKIINDDTDDEYEFEEIPSDQIPSSNETPFDGSTGYEYPAVELPMMSPAP